MSGDLCPVCGRSVYASAPYHGVCLNQQADRIAELEKQVASLEKQLLYLKVHTLNLEDALEGEES